MLGWLRNWRKQKQQYSGNIQTGGDPQGNSYEHPPDIISTPEPLTQEDEWRQHDREYKDRQITTNRWLIAVTAITAGVAFWQGILTRQANEQTRLALHVSERAYITIVSPQFDIATSVFKITVSNIGHIPSGQIEAVAHEATVNVEVPNTPPDLTHAIERQWHRHNFPSLSPGPGFEIGIPIRAFSESKVEHGSQGIVVGFRVSYQDGFPDDQRDKLSVCIQSVYQYIIKQIVWVPCDPNIVLPKLEALDGYPNPTTEEQH